MKDSFHIQWHITNSCNLRCRHCYQEDFSNRDDPDWPKLKRISDNILATLQEWDKKACIHLTGGEPLLKPELFSLLDELNQESVVEELGIITNGLLIDGEVVRRLSAFSKLKKIKISLDGADAEINDAIRRKGSFEQVVRRVPLIKKENRFDILFMFTLMRRNFRSLSSFINLCQDLGVNGLILERFIPWGRGREIMDEVLDKEEWKEVVEGLLRQDEQSLLTLVLYNRLVDIFTGLTCFHIQNHYRSFVTGMGEVELDALYVGVDKTGTLSVIPIEAKSQAESEMIGRIQVSQMAKLVRQDFADLRRRILTVKALMDGTIAIAEFDDHTEPDDIGIVSVSRFQLIRRNAASGTLRTKG